MINFLMLKILRLDPKPWWSAGFWPPSSFDHDLNPNMYHETVDRVGCLRLSGLQTLRGQDPKPFGLVGTVATLHCASVYKATQNVH